MQLQFETHNRFGHNRLATAVALDSAAVSECVSRPRNTSWKESEHAQDRRYRRLHCPFADCRHCVRRNYPSPERQRCACQPIGSPRRRPAWRIRRRLAWWFAWRLIWWIGRRAQQRRRATRCRFSARAWRRSAWRTSSRRRTRRRHLRSRTLLAGLAVPISIFVLLSGFIGHIFGHAASSVLRCTEQHAAQAVLVLLRSAGRLLPVREDLHARLERIAHHGTAPCGSCAGS